MAGIIAEKIKNKKAEANDLASKLDRTYPKRLIDNKVTNKESISVQEVIERLRQLETERTMLNDVGLLDIEDTYIDSNVDYFENDETIKNVLLLYIGDSNSKLSIYKDLSKRIYLFLDIINKRFAPKRFLIDKLKGFICLSKINEDIPLTSLSSGEQHEIVLFYELIFNTEPDTFLLIDEPEISLHISWQNEFINDLKQVIDINAIDILIATHSPDIINNYWDLTNQLKESE